MDVFYTLFEETGLPDSLSEFGITETDLDQLAEDAVASGSCAFNPRVPTQEDIRTIFQALL